MNKVLIFTDGACSGNPGPGGAGAVFWKWSVEAQNWTCVGYSSRAATHSTNNVAEFDGLLLALALVARAMAAAGLQGRPDVAGESRMATAGLQGRRRGRRVERWRRPTSLSSAARAVI